MAETAIEWTDVVWNPTRGCSRVSEGCRHCYAERQAIRHAGPGGRYEGLARSTPAGPRWTGRVELVESKLDEPLRWRTPRRVFVNSMSDLFHEALPFEATDAVFNAMAEAPQHTFQVLTKRPERMLEWFRDREQTQERAAYAWPNVWLGVSVEDQATADERIPLLLQTPAAVRFVSYEPALEAVDFRPWLAPTCAGVRADGSEGSTCANPEHRPARLDWVIAGGESGPGARPCDVEWIRSVVRQCREAGVACFIKQLGATVVIAPRQDDPIRFARHPKKGDPSEWPADLQVREFPAVLS